MRTFTLSYLVTAVALVLAFLWAGVQGLFVCALMAIMDISFSFDNAVVNATVLRKMSPAWQKRFLTWGMLIAVFGMYYLFPLLIVSVATGIGLLEVMHMAISTPAAYRYHLDASHTQIAAFGGMFLLMVFLNFVFDEGKTLHWLGRIEAKLAKLGALESAEILVALVLLILVQWLLPETERVHAVVAGGIGIALFVALQNITAMLGMESKSTHAGLVGFIYLNLLDASFSLDAVVGSFAISNDIVIIVLGLTAGAMFVRSLTVHMVQKGTLEQYIFLEHGAHYAIGALALIMLVSLVTPVSQVLTGLIGLVVLLASFWSSVKHNKKHQ